MPGLEVLRPGLASSIQDLGRAGYSHLGISAAGAADPVSLRIGNRLLGNAPDAPALEMTLTGGEFRFGQAAVIALTGADFGPALDGAPVPGWTCLEVKPGQTLRLGPATSGARGYLCLSGGFKVDAVLGSASTHARTGLGGLQGRFLRKGDTLSYDPPHGRSRPGRRFPADVAAGLLKKRYLRVLPGPQAGQFADEATARFSSSAYIVGRDSDRMGLRLSGPPLARTVADDLLTEGVPLGAVQVTPDGLPIILFVDHQTTGGYPKIAVVIAADLHRLGQLRPRDEVRFVFVRPRDARLFHMSLDDVVRGDSCF